ncbi:MAG: hypothetical protein U0269_18030 [Polyangiales bacterium]
MSIFTALIEREPPDNALRFDGRAGHVESYFFRANDPSRPRAFWLKQTILAPLDGPALAESWFIWFDAERGRTIAHRVSQPYSQAIFTGFGDPSKHLETRAITVELAPNGSARGELEPPEGRVSFDVRWSPLASPIAEPLSIFPCKLLRTGPFPRSKLLSPLPALAFSGAIELPDERVEFERWPGMQGHNWGKEHTFEYAWGQCLFADDDAMVEGFTGRVRVAGRASPRVSAMVVRRGARTYRFDTIFDTWRQRAEVELDRWALTLRSRDGEATLVMNAADRPMVCLGYDNPNGEPSYCFNSKLAEVELTVRPSDGAQFVCKSPHGGALEFLRRQRDPRFERVV